MGACQYPQQAADSTQSPQVVCPPNPCSKGQLSRTLAVLRRGYRRRGCADRGWQLSQSAALQSVAPSCMVRWSGAAMEHQGLRQQTQETSTCTGGSGTHRQAPAGDGETGGCEASTPPQMAQVCALTAVVSKGCYSRLLCLPALEGRCGSPGGRHGSTLGVHLDGSRFEFWLSE